MVQRRGLGGDIHRDDGGVADRHAMAGIRSGRLPHGAAADRMVGLHMHEVIFRDMANGLEVPSQIGVDRPQTARRSRRGPTIGRLTCGDPGLTARSGQTH